MDNRLTRRYDSPLQCPLDNPDGSDSERKAQVQFHQLQEMGDEIRVSVEENTYFVRINPRAAEIIDETGTIVTRYGNGEKITIFISDSQR